MFVQVVPDLFDETPVVLGCFAPFNEQRFVHEVDFFLVRTKVLVDPFGEIRVSVEKAFVDV